MVEISRLLFEQTCSGQDCNYLMHPWHQNCFNGCLMFSKDAFIGSAKFYSVLYLIQIAMRGKKMQKKKEWIKLGEYYIRSTTLGFLVAATACPMGCFFRYLGGNKIGYYSYILIPNILNGVSIFLEPPSRRGLVVNLFSNLIIEYWLRIAERAGYLTLSKYKQTLMFMMGSAALFYLMRLEGDKPQRTPLLWLFTPEKVRRKSDGKGICPHSGPCSKHISNGFLKMAGLGLAISLSKIILPNLGSPMKALSMIRLKHFKTAAFFGSYIGIYRAVVCYLCHKHGRDSATYAVPAGLLSGLSFVFSPSLGVSIACVTAAFKLYSTILYERGVLPANVPLPELLYCFCQGTLFHARFMHPDVCPQYIFKLMNSVSNGRSEILYKNMMQVINSV